MRIDMMYLSMLSILLPTCFGAVLFKRLPVSLKVLSIFIFLSVILEGATYFTYSKGMNNMWLFHLYSFLEFATISLIYFFAFKSRPLKVMVIMASVIFLVLSTFNLLFNEQVSEFNSFQRYMGTILLLSYFVAQYIVLLNSRNAPFLELHPYFILTTGFLVYFLGTMYLFLYANEFIKNNIQMYWTIHGVLNIFLNAIYSITLWKGSKVAELL